MAKLRVAYEYTEAEDKSIRLGLFLIISGVVSLFIFGFCWLSPALQDLQATAANCTVLSVQQIGEVFECTFTCGADCRGTSQYPCVQVYVNNSESNSRALLHSDEHQLLTNPKVRTPGEKCLAPTEILRFGGASVLNPERGGSQCAGVTSRRQSAAGYTSKSKYVGGPPPPPGLPVLQEGLCACGDPWCSEAFFTHLSCLVSDSEALAQLRFGACRTGFGEMQGAES